MVHAKLATVQAGLIGAILNSHDHSMHPPLFLKDGMMGRWATTMMPQKPSLMPSHKVQTRPADVDRSEGEGKGKERIEFGAIRISLRDLENRVRSVRFTPRGVEKEEL